MTNREYYAANPEKLTGDIWIDALEWTQNNYTYSEIMSMCAGEIISKYLDAQHEKPETTVVTTIEVTEIFKGIPSPSQINKCYDKICAWLKEVLDADNVQIGNVQRFERGSE